MHRSSLPKSASLPISLEHDDSSLLKSIALFLCANVLVILILWYFISDKIDFRNPSDGNTESRQHVSPRQLDGGAKSPGTPGTGIDSAKKHVTTPGSGNYGLKRSPRVDSPTRPRDISCLVHSESRGDSKRHQPSSTRSRSPSGRVLFGMDAYKSNLDVRSPPPVYFYDANIPESLLEERQVSPSQIAKSPCVEEILDKMLHVNHPDGAGPSISKASPAAAIKVLDLSHAERKRESDLLRSLEQRNRDCTLQLQRLHERQAADLQLTISELQKCKLFAEVKKAAPVVIAPAIEASSVPKPSISASAQAPNTTSKQSSASLPFNSVGQAVSKTDAAAKPVSEGLKKGFVELSDKIAQPTETKAQQSEPPAVDPKDKVVSSSSVPVKSKALQDRGILAILDELNSRPLLINASSDDSAFVASLPEAVKGALNAVPNVSTFTADLCTVALAIEVSKRINEVLDAAVLCSDEVSLGIRVLLLKRIVNAVQTAVNDDAVYILGYLIGCVMRGNDSLGEEVRRYIMSRSPLCWPCLEAVEGVSSAPLALDSTASYAILMGFLIQRAEDIKVFGIEEGWSWMVKIGKKLGRIITEIQKPDMSATGRAELEKAFNIGCTALLGFLRQTWRLWTVRFGRSPIDAVARALASVCTKASATSNLSKGAHTLNDFLSGLIAMDSNFSKQYGKQSALQALPIKLQSSSLLKLKMNSESVDKTKEPEIVQKKSSVEIASIALPFNILNAQAESQEKALNMLAQRLNKARDLQDRDFLKYVVYKITVAAVNYCRNDCFDIKGSGLPLVRIICHLCASGGPVISSIFKMQLLDQCPVIRPHVSDVLPLDAFRDHMGFLSKKSGTGQGLIWEPGNKWTSRVTKLLGVFALLCVQPEQVVYTYADAWVWISQIINTCSSVEGGLIEPTALFMDTYLRVVSPALLEQYGPVYLRLLESVQSVLVPRLPKQEGMLELPVNTYNKQLDAFLTEAITSRGANFPALTK